MTAGAGDATAADERARLIGAAWTVLERSGFEGFKVQLLLRETGLSARTFYRHFPDKDALFLTLMADEYSRVGARLRAVLAQAAAPEEKVVAWARELVLAAADPKRAARARLFTSQPAVVRRFADVLAVAACAILDPLEAAIVEGRDAGVFPLAEPEGDALLIHDLAGAAMSTALARPGTEEDIAAAVAHFVLRALGARPRGAAGVAGAAPGPGPVRRAASSREGTAPRTRPA
jgi:AcrR family transcriptional regulator